LGKVLITDETIGVSQLLGHVLGYTSTKSTPVAMPLMMRRIWLISRLPL